MTNRSLLPVGFILTTAAAYLNTRGKDGQFIGSIVSFTILAIVYWIGLWKSEKLTSRMAFLHLLVFEGGTILGMLIDPGLEEMAGMLYEFIPIGVLAIVVSGDLIQRFRRRGPGD